MMRCDKCNSENVVAKSSQKIWIVFLLAIVMANYIFQPSDLASLIVGIVIGAVVVLFYNKLKSKEYYCSNCGNTWLEQGIYDKWKS
jgi:ribosomal protein L37AE/L43A